MTRTGSRFPRSSWPTGNANSLKGAVIDAGKSKPTSWEQQLENETAELDQALRQVAAEIHVWERSAEGCLAPSKTST